jgi:hypothetical protein
LYPLSRTDPFPVVSIIKNRPFSFSDPFPTLFFSQWNGADLGFEDLEGLEGGAHHFFGFFVDFTGMRMSLCAAFTTPVP